MLAFCCLLPIFHYLFRNAKSYISSFGLIYGFIVSIGNAIVNTFWKAFHIGQKIDCKTKVAFHGFPVFVITGLGNIIFTFVYLTNTVFIGKENCDGII